MHKWHVSWSNVGTFWCVTDAIDITQATQRARRVLGIPLAELTVVELAPSGDTAVNQPGRSHR